MAKTPLSTSDEYELVDKDRDIRGWKVQDHAGNVLGKVTELIVDTERETVTHIVVDKETQYAIRDIEIADDRIVLGATATAMNRGGVSAAAETVRIETVAPAVDAQGDMRLQVIEERLRVGKRQVEQGGVRVSSHVTDSPAQAQVQLKEEHVEVTRRVVDRTATATDLANLTNRTVDVVERAEVAVVAKEARVVEEVVVKRDVEERNETVNETVRRKDVEVRDIKAPAKEVEVRDIKQTTDPNRQP
jgi:uncharacterized protein (TIGR02271 family)